MYMHIYFFQKWEKSCDLNEDKKFVILLMLIKITLLNDIFYTITKYYSIIYAKENLKFMVVFPMVQFFISFWILSPLEIESFSATFKFIKYVWLVMNSFKTILIFCQLKFVSDLIKLVDVVWLTNLILISITDPLVNTKESQKVTFYEPYFRYMEFHVLMLCFPLVYNDRNIDQDVQYNLFTTSAIIGKYDSFRFSVILIIAHYYFVFVNSLAFSMWFFIGFTSIPVAFYTISKYRQRKMKNVYMSFSLLLIWNLIAYFFALSLSVNEES